MTKPLRIALLVDPITALLRGGRHAAELSRELEGRGHHVRVFGAPASSLQTSADDDPQSQRQASGGARILSFQPDALVAYDALSPAAWLGSRISRRRHVPLILVEPGSFTGGSWMQRSLWRIGEGLWGAYVRHTAGALMALDPQAQAHALREGFPTKKIQVLPHGVDVERYRPGLSSPLIFRHRIRGRILLYAGRLDPRSGLETLINAFAQTVGQRGDWSLVIAGTSGRRTHVPAGLRACADRLGVGARVHTIGVEEVDLPALMASATLCAFPAHETAASHEEVARAMACGTPVLASDVARHAFLVEDGHTGLVAPAGDLSAWTRMLQRASGSPEARRRWGAQARTRALERLAWSAVGDAYERTLFALRAEFESREPSVARTAESA